MLTRSQIDRLGERLRGDVVSESDLRLLDSYRRSFAPAYEGVISTLRSTLNLEPTGRPAKSTTAVRAKLQRESIRLSQMQDIAGCRLIVLDAPSQSKTIGAVAEAFAKAAISDRREKPSYGYRAVHIMVHSLSRIVEVQIRTMLQHQWAEVSEKFSDLVDPAIKYGGGPQELRSVLDEASRILGNVEALEREFDVMLGSAPPRELWPEGLEEKIAGARNGIQGNRKELTKILQNLAILNRQGL